MSPFRLKGTAGPVLNRSFPLSDRLRIGGPECEVVIDEARPGALVEVRFDAGRVSVQALDKALEQGVELAVNGHVVTESELAGGDELRVGASRLLLQAPGLRPERVLTEEAVRRRGPLWPWWAAAGLLAAAAGAGWYYGAWERLLALLGTVG